MRLSINYALEDGLDSPEAIEALVMQICYRAADLWLLLAAQMEENEIINIL